jgi:hypothetical protein
MLLRWIHLFFECNFSRRIWIYLQIDWEQADNIETMFIRARAGFAKPFFTEIVILACWNIWKMRNEYIFQHVRLPLEPGSINSSMKLHCMLIGSKTNTLNPSRLG